MESKWTLLYVLFVILLSFATTDKPKKIESYKGMETAEQMEIHLEKQVRQMEMKLDTIEKRNFKLRKKLKNYVPNNAK